MTRVRFAGVAQPARPPANHDAWGSDDEPEPGHPVTPQPQQHHHQQQPNRRLSAQVLAQLPQTFQPSPAATSSGLQSSSSSSLSKTTTAAAAAAFLDTSSSSSSSSSRRASSRAVHSNQHVSPNSTAASAFQDLQQQQQQQVPSLQKVCLGVLGRHVTELVQQLGEQLSWLLPPEVKAALLAVARRRDEVTADMLAALSDASWRQLDISSCRMLFGAEIMALAPRMPDMQVIDVTGCDRLSSGGWRQLAASWPSLAVIRLGGSQTCSEEAMKALPHILPGIEQRSAPAPAKCTTSSELHPAAAIAETGGSSSSSSSSSSGGGSSGTVRAAVAAEAAAATVAADEEPGLDSWEDAFDSDNDDQGQPSSCSSSREQPAAAAAAPPPPRNSRLKQLRVLVWPDVPKAAVELVQQRCPRVVINPVIKRDPVTGELPPRELDSLLPLDEPLMELVGPEALKDAQQRQQRDSVGSSGSGGPAAAAAGVHIADKFRAAYIEQAAGARARERRLQQQQARRQLRSSHALRTLNAWLDEPA